MIEIIARSKEWNDQLQRSTWREHYIVHLNPDTVETIQYRVDDDREEYVSLSFKYTNILVHTPHQEFRTEWRHVFGLPNPQLPNNEEDEEDEDNDTDEGVMEVS